MKVLFLAMNFQISAAKSSALPFCLRILICDQVNSSSMKQSGSVACCSFDNLIIFKPQSA